MKKRLLIILIILLSIFFLAHTVSAAGAPNLSDVNPLKSLSGSAGSAIATMISWVIKAVLGIVGGIALLLFVYGGMMMIASAGSPDKINKGKEILIWATIGLLVILSSYMLVTFVITGVTTGPAAAPAASSTTPTGSTPTPTPTKCPDGFTCALKCTGLLNNQGVLKDCLASEYTVVIPIADFPTRVKESSTTNTSGPECTGNVCYKPD